MRVRASILVMALVAAVAWTARCRAAGPASDRAGLQMLAELGTRLKTRTVWTAAYRQTFIPVGMASGEEVNGRIWIGWPDRALFKSGDPVNRIMGLAGRRVRLVDLADSSCEDHTLTDDEWQRIPLVAVLDPTAALKHFAVTVDADHRLVLAPIRVGGVRRVELEMGDDGMPAEVVVLDPQGAVNRFTFRSWHGGDRGPAGGWIPAPPRDIPCTAMDDRAADPG